MKPILDLLARVRFRSPRSVPAVRAPVPLLRVSALGEMTEGSYRRALELLNRKLAKQSSQENGTHAQN